MKNLIVPTNIGVFFDTETSGMVNWKHRSDGIDQPHLTQLAAVSVDLDTREIINTMEMCVKVDGWRINPDCIELNGFDANYLNAIGMPEVQVLEMFMSLWNKSLRFAYNTTFDNRVIRIGLKRYFAEADQEAWKAGKYECQMIAARKHLGGKNPKLEVAYKEICGKELVGAHTAMSDTLACMEIYFKLKDLNAESGDIFQ